jgi:hypothetical protein
MESSMGPGSQDGVGSRADLGSGAVTGPTVAVEKMAEAYAAIGLPEASQCCLSTPRWRFSVGTKRGPSEPVTSQPE